MSDLLRSLLTDLPESDPASADAVRTRAGSVLRPEGALQRLDDIAVHMAGWRQTTTPTVERPGVVVFAGDHGIAAAGVSKYPSDITAAMLAAVQAERATINAMARAVGAQLSVHDVGVGDPTADIRFDDAMSPERADGVAQAAIDAVDAHHGDGVDLLVLGELGIGNTTAAAALAAALLDGGVETYVGRGTGVDDDGLQRKREAVRTAVERVAHVDDPIEIARRVGGAELFAMAAACARARQHRIPVVLDGYLAGAAVLPLALATPGALDHCIAGHRSAERGHRLILEHLGMAPLLELEMRLGEGSGALAAVPLVRLACASVVDVATFDEWFGG